MDRPVISANGKLEVLRALARHLISISPRFENFVPGHRASLPETMSMLGSLSKWTQASLAPLLAPPPAEPATVPVPTPAHFGQPNSAITAQVRQALENLPASKLAAQSTLTPPVRRAGIGASALQQGAGVPQHDPMFSHPPSARTEYQRALKNPSLVQALLALHARTGGRGRQRDVIKPNLNSSTHSDFVSAQVPRNPSPTHSSPVGHFSGADFMVEDVPLVDAVSKPGPVIRSSDTATHSILRSAPQSRDDSSPNQN